MENKELENKKRIEELEDLLDRILDGIDAIKGLADDDEYLEIRETIQNEL